MTVTITKSLNLALKHRPKVLDQIIGQDNFVSILKQKIKVGDLNRSILLTGPTGCGKTTLARMLAHYVNCGDQEFVKENATPCWDCEYCDIISKRPMGSYPDVLEYNFSESRGLETIREIMNAARYEPSNNMKVFILDEIQCITNIAQNALLKILEEPPANIMFILATTDPQKLLPTLKNRCLSIELKTVDNPTMIGFLKKIVSLEGVKAKIGDLAYLTIAKLSGGHVRQALSSLENVIAAIEMDGFDQTKEGMLEGVISKQATIVSPTLETRLKEYLIDGVYAGDRAVALKSAQKLFSEINSQFVYNMTRIITYNNHSLGLLLSPDPKKDFELTDPAYNSWYNKLIENCKAGKLLLTTTSASKLNCLLSDLIFKSKTYEYDLESILKAYTCEMLDIVLKYADVPAEKPYTTGSPIHKMYAKDKLVDDD